MNSSDINDIRLQTEFRHMTFSGYRKTDAKKELINNLKKSKIEPACYWSAEFICAGYYHELWDIIISFFSKYIHIGNPKIITYLEFRIQLFNQIMQNGYVGMELQLRNNVKIRQIFAEVICVICEAKKRHEYNEIKIKPEDFDLTYMTERFQAPDVSYAENVFLKDDPKELFIPANEFAYNISVEGCNSVNACYWMEWFMQFDQRCKSRREKCKCERRIFANVNNKLQMEIIWILWDCFLYEATNRSVFIQKLVASALNIFCMNFAVNCHKKRRYIMYFVIEIFTEQIPLDDTIIKNKDKIQNVINNIKIIYKQIKKNEISPNTDYLYKNLDSSNLNKTIAILETMNAITSDFTPRIEQDSI